MRCRVRGSFASSPSARRRLQQQPSRDTAPELAVRRALHAQGIRYRTHVRPVATLRREADLVLRRARIAVFVDGCFWHGCPRHGPKRFNVNRWFWEPKIASNKERDRNTTKALHAAGWRVVRAWEHEDPLAVARRVVRALDRWATAQRLARHVRRARQPTKSAPEQR